MSGVRTLLARKPYSTIAYNAASMGNNITTAAWKEIVAALETAACAVEIFNSTGRILQISLGASGQEDENVMKYTIIPGGSEILVPSEWMRGKRLSLKAVDANATTGWLIFNFFG